MDIVYIISQVFGFAAFITSQIAFHQKKKDSIFQTLVIGNTLDVIHYLLLGAYSGCITKVMALIRNEIIIAKDKNKKINKPIVLIIILIAYIPIGILTYKDIYSILPIISAVVYVIFVWNGNALTVKRVAFVCYFLWLTYNICVFSIAGIVSDCVAIVSTAIAIYNAKKNNNIQNLKEDLKENVNGKENE